MTLPIKWLTGALALLGLLAWIVLAPPAFLFFRELPYLPFLQRALFILLITAGLCLYRIGRGPTAADRIVAVDILGILIVGLCAVLGIASGRSWYIDIGIAWALQSFISTLALAKYLEGKGLEE